MIPTTTTIEQDFQVLNPITVAPPGSNPLAYLEEGHSPFTIGVQTLTVTFQVAKIAVYEITEAEILNVLDPNPINFSLEFTAISLTGFTVILSGLPDTGNYALHWTVQVPPS